MKTNFDTLKAALASLPGLTPEARAQSLKILSALKTDAEREKFMGEITPIATKIQHFSEAAVQAVEQMTELVHEAEKSAKQFQRKKRERSSAKRDSRKLKKLESSFEQS